jgi:hypothetical protein
VKAVWPIFLTLEFVDTIAYAFHELDGQVVVGNVVVSGLGLDLLSECIGALSSYQ